MSATGRGARLDPSGLDFYPTPPWPVRALATVWRPPPGILVEPCSGDGAIIEAWPQRRRKWIAVDIDNERTSVCRTLPNVLEAHTVDCRTLDMRRRSVGAVISNPPFVDAAEILLWAHSRLPHGTPIVFLERVGFSCAKEGREFMADMVPDEIRLSDRPSFRDRWNKKLQRWEPGSDASEYSWFIWHAGIWRKTGKLRILPKGCGR